MFEFLLKIIILFQIFLNDVELENFQANYNFHNNLYYFLIFQLSNSVFRFLNNNFELAFFPKFLTLLQIE